jgi:peptide chain release factor subunit 1
MIVAGPGPIKYDFLKGNFLHYQLKEKVISTIDTAYVGRQGVKEVVERAPDIMRKVRYVEETKLMQGFLYEIGHDTGLSTYGENEVRRVLKMGAVKVLLLSEDLDIVRVNVECTACNYSRLETIKTKSLGGFRQNLGSQTCLKCRSPSLIADQTTEVVEELAEKAANANAETEIITTDTEEGQMLLNAFGGIAAVLRFKV